MANVTVIKHPLVQQNLTILRDKRTGPQEFRRVMSEAAALMIYEATRTLELEVKAVATPLARTKGHVLKREVVLVPVLRAGLGMMEAILRLIPRARVGFIGLKRDEKSLNPLFYHKSLPKDLRHHEVILIDPMLATGGSTVTALDLIKELGGRRIRVVNLVAAPEGIAMVQKSHPGIPIYTAAIDKQLNERGFILPGLGDAGDRLFGV